MSEDGNDSSTSFIRQRRDLFVISALLIIGQLAHPSLNKLSLLGAEIEIQNSIILIQAAWTLWLYWLVRYWQAFRKIPGRLISSKYELLKYSSFSKKTIDVARKEIEKINANHLADKANSEISDPRIYEHDGGLGKDKYSWVATIRNDKLISTSPPSVIDFNPFFRFWTKLKALFSLCVLEIEFTEYLLPFFFALIPFFIWLYKII
jgi:hypothetical protein